MKHRWRRLLLTLSAVLLALGLIIVGSLIWLHTSGRLATLAQDLLQRLSGQEVRIEAVAFPAWNVVAFTGVRLQQHLAGWHVEFICPRVEAHYGLQGLLNKQVEYVRLLRPQIRAQMTPAAAPASASPVVSPTQALPVKRLTVEQGILNLRWYNVVSAWRQIDANLQQRQDRRLAIVVSGTLDEQEATVHVQGDVPLDRPQPAGSWQLTASSLPLSRLLQTFPDLLPPRLAITRGTLDASAQLTFQAQMLHGTLRAQVAQADVQTDNLSLQALSVNSETTVEGNLEQASLRLQGTVHARSERAAGPQALLATRLMLDAPLRLAYTPEAWQASADLALQSETLQAGNQVHVQRPTATVPLQAQATQEGWQLQGTVEVATSTAQVNVTAPTDVQMQFHDIHARLPFTANATALEMRDAEVQSKAWQWSAANTTQSYTHLGAHASSQLDLQRQQWRFPHLDVTLGELGSVSVSGAWSWPEQTLHDLQLHVAPNTMETLWSSLAAFVPETYRTWQVQGKMHLDVQTPRLFLHDPGVWSPLAIVWKLQDVAFSNADGNVATENLNGSVQVTLSHARRQEPYAFQGTLTLEPFALLLGSFFPALQANRIAPVVTITGTYHTPTERLQLDLSGQFSDIGTLTLQGQIRQPLGLPQYDLLCQLRQINVARLWQTMVHDTGLLSPSLAQAATQGTLNAQLQIRGQTTATLLQGHLDLADFYLHSDVLHLQGTSLQLPLDIRYPLPDSAVDATILPASAYGQVRIAQLDIGALHIESFTTRLAIRSDSMVFPEEVTLLLLDGRIRLQRLTAEHLLQPQRRLQWQAEIENLNLRHLQRDPGGLPLAGVVHGTLRRVHVLGDRLETEGVLTLQVAGGSVRISEVQGHDLFSRIPTLQGSFATDEPLSLLQLTRIYPIGDISGTLHLRIDDLILTAGEPAAFHLTFHVEEKRGEVREITLRALNNLLFTTGSAKLAASLLGDAYRLPYKHFGAEITLQLDTLHLRGLYHDNKGLEYFMQAPTFGGGVSIVNRVPENGIPFRDFLRRLQATVVERPDVKVR